MIINVCGSDVKICYIPGSKQLSPGIDTLSEAPVHNDGSGADKEFNAINLVLSVSDERYEEFQKETKIDPELQAVLSVVKNGWPDTKVQVPVEARLYWKF